VTPARVPGSSKILSFCDLQHRQSLTFFSRPSQKPRLLPLYCFRQAFLESPFFTCTEGRFLSPQLRFCSFRVGPWFLSFVLSPIRLSLFVGEYPNAGAHEFFPILRMLAVYFSFLAAPRGLICQIFSLHSVAFSSGLMFLCDLVFPLTNPGLSPTDHPFFFFVFFFVWFFWGGCWGGGGWLFVFFCGWGFGWGGGGGWVGGGGLGCAHCFVPHVFCNIASPPGRTFFQLNSLLLRRFPSTRTALSFPFPLLTVVFSRPPALLAPTEIVFF